MVDFNNENTVTRSAIDIMRVLVLEKREDCLQALKGFNKQDYLQTDPPDSDFRARVSILYEELRSAIERTDSKLSKEIEKLVHYGDFAELLQGFRLLNKYLDKIKLTRLDINEDYDTTNIEEENERKGL